MDNISLDKQKALELIMDDSTIIIDVRTPEELEEVPPIVEDCFNIPFDDEFMQVIQEEGDDITKESKILLYCTHGVRSLKATVMLREAGYVNAYNLDGGIAAIFDSEAC